MDADFLRSLRQGAGQVDLSFYLRKDEVLHKSQIPDEYTRYILTLVNNSGNPNSGGNTNPPNGGGDDSCGYVDPDGTHVIVRENNFDDDLKTLMNRLRALLNSSGIGGENTGSGSTGTGSSTGTIDSGNTHVIINEDNLDDDLKSLVEFLRGYVNPSTETGEGTDGGTFEHVVINENNLDSNLKNLVNTIRNHLRNTSAGSTGSAESGEGEWNVNIWNEEFPNVNSDGTYSTLGQIITDLKDSVGTISTQLSGYSDIALQEKIEAAISRSLQNSGTSGGSTLNFGTRLTTVEGTLNRIMDLLNGNPSSGTGETDGTNSEGTDTGETTHVIVREENLDNELRNLLNLLRGLLESSGAGTTGGGNSGTNTGSNTGTGSSSGNSNTGSGTGTGGSTSTGGGTNSGSDGTLIINENNFDKNLQNLMSLLRDHLNSSHDGTNTGGGTSTGGGQTSTNGDFKKGSIVEGQLLKCINSKDGIVDSAPMMIRAAVVNSTDELEDEKSRGTGKIFTTSGVLYKYNASSKQYEDVNVLDDVQYNNVFIYDTKMKMLRYVTDTGTLLSVYNDSKDVSADESGLLMGTPGDFYMDMKNLKIEPGKKIEIERLENFNRFPVSVLVRDAVEGSRTENEYINSEGIVTVANKSNSVVLYNDSSDTVDVRVLIPNLGLGEIARDIEMSCGYIARFAVSTLEPGRTISFERNENFSYAQPTFLIHENTEKWETYEENGETHTRWGGGFETKNLFNSKGFYEQNAEQTDVSKLTPWVEGGYESSTYVDTGNELEYINSEGILTVETLMSTIIVHNTSDTSVLVASPMARMPNSGTYTGEFYDETSCSYVTETATVEGIKANYKDIILEAGGHIEISRPDNFAKLPIKVFIKDDTPGSNTLGSYINAEGVVTVASKADSFVLYNDYYRTAELRVFIPIPKSNNENNIRLLAVTDDVRDIWDYIYRIRNKPSIGIDWE